MSETLFSNLKRIGIDEELATRVSASLDPKYNASKADVLVLQETILQVQMKTDERMLKLEQKTDDRYNNMQKALMKLEQKTDERYNNMQNALMKLEQKTDERYNNLHQEMHEGFTKVRTEMGAMHRQFWLTYLGLITTIISVFLTNYYFHMG